MKYILPFLLSFIAFIGAILVFNLTQSLLIAIITLLVVFWSNEALPIGIVSLFPNHFIPFTWNIRFKSHYC